MISQLSQVSWSFRCLNWAEIGFAVGAGAVGGMLGFAGAALGASIAGSGLMGALLAGSMGGLASGVGIRTAQTALSGNWENWQNDIFNPCQMAADLAFGAVGGGVGYGVRYLSRGFAQSPSNISVGSTIFPRNPPNPHGKLGGPAHQAEIKKITRYLKDNKIAYRTEFKINTPNGYKPYRLIDLAAFDSEGNPMIFYQVGKGTMSNIPVIRERRAITDIFEYSGYEIPIIFIPYW